MTRLFAYLWAFLRAAERTTRQRPSRAGDVFVELFGHAFRPQAPDYAHPEKNRRKTGAWGDGVWVGRLVLNEAFAKANPSEDAKKASRRAANLLNRDKSPIAPLSHFVRTDQFRQVAAGELRLARLLKPDDAKDFHEHFDFNSEELEFLGIPIVGGGFPRFTVWFGLSLYSGLWDRSTEERAAALAVPVRGLPELTLSWSPMDDWRPPSYPVSQASLDYQTIALCSYALASEMTPSRMKVGRKSAEYLHGTLDGVTGYAMMAPLYNWKEPQSEQGLIRLLAFVAASGTLRPDLLLVCSGLADEVVASAAHRYHADSQHPLLIFHASIQDLHALVRHFPWLWFALSESGDAIPFLSSRHEDIGATVRFACFLDYCRHIAPAATREMLAQCWRYIRRTDDFDALCHTVELGGMLPPKWSTAADLLVPKFIFQAPTLSRAADLIREIEDWFLVHYEQLGPDWRAVIIQLGRFNERAHAAWGVNQNLPRALQAYRLAAESDDPDSLAHVAFLTLRIGDVQRGLVLVENLMQQVPNRAEGVRRTVLDIAEASLLSKDFRRFAEITAWDELKKTHYVRPFVSQAIGLLHDEQLGEAAVHHLLRVGLMNQILHEIHPGSSSPTQHFLHNLVPKLQRAGEENVRAALDALALALRFSGEDHVSR